MSRRYYKKKKDGKKPGPGNYKPKFSLIESEGPSFSCRGKTPIKEYRKAPGPGTYFKNGYVSRAPTPKIGSGQRLGFYMINKVPGPGKYKPRPSSASTYKRDPRLKFGK